MSEVLLGIITFLLATLVGVLASFYKYMTRVNDGKFEVVNTNIKKLQGQFQYLKTRVTGQKEKKIAVKKKS